jgi:hypothetical protein
MKGTRARGGRLPRAIRYPCSWHPRALHHSPRSAACILSLHCLSTLVFCSDCRRGHPVKSPRNQPPLPAQRQSWPAVQAVRLLDAVNADEARRLLQPSMRYVIKRSFPPRLWESMFLRSALYRHRLEAEQEPSHWHLRVCVSTAQSRFIALASSLCIISPHIIHDS